MDTDAFFRTATLKICSNLALERALHATLLFIRDYMPVDQLVAEYFDPALGAARTIARADVHGGTALNLVVPIPREIRKDESSRANAVLGQAVILNRPEENPLAVTMLRLHRYDVAQTSALIMQLVGEHDTFGGLVALAHRRDAFNESHARLFTMLADPFKVALVNALQHRDLESIRDRLADDNRQLHRELRRMTGEEIIGADFGLRDLMQLMRRVAPTESPVLLIGETGVGKDVIANAIHQSSPRRDGPFIPVNCGAIPAALIDSELFGHEKGAFTGALATKRGRFERADKGTILLDEIGEMPLDAQVRLLRVLQNREIERVGGMERIPIDVRIIAATHRDLEQMVREGHFRKDLWFRLNVFPMVVPPLRERVCDIPALVQYLVEQKAKELKLAATPQLSEGAIDGLMAYDWPGNVRELANAVERAMILSHGEPLRFDGLRPSVQRPATEAVSDTGAEVATLDMAVAQHITRVLRMTGGKIHGPGGAGERLGINPNTLRHKMQKLGIPFRKKDEES